MNPRISPSTKAVTLLPGKNGVCRNLNGGISSHFKDGENSTLANYDLNFLDVVPSTVKSNSPKNSSVHFSPEKKEESSAAPKNAGVNGSSHQHAGCGQSKGQVGSSFANGDRHGFIAPASGQTRISSDSLKGLEHSEASEILALRSGKRCPAAGRSNSFNVQSNPSPTPVQRSHSVSREDARPFRDIDNTSLGARLGETNGGASFLKSRDHRFFSAEPSATATSGVSTSACLPASHRPSAGAKKDSGMGLSVHFADSVLGSPKLRDKASSVRTFEMGSPLLKKEFRPLYCDTNQKIYINTIKHSSHFERDEKRLDMMDPVSNSSLYPMKNCLPSHDSREDLRLRHYKDSHTSPSDGEFGHHTPSKIPTSTSNGHGGGSKGLHVYFDHPSTDVKFGTSNSTSLGSNSSLTSTSLKLLDQLKHDHHNNGVTSSLSLTPSSSLSSSSSLSKEITPPNLYDYSCSSPSSITKHSRYGLNSEDVQLSSLSSAPAPLSVSTPSSKFNSRRSSACLRSDCVFQSRLDYISDADIALKDSLTRHPASPSTLMKHRPVILPPSLGSGNSLALARKYEADLLPFTDDKEFGENLASLIKKESIAASYQLEYCWFCGRPMPPFGSR